MSRRTGGAPSLNKEAETEGGTSSSCSSRSSEDPARRKRDAVKAFFKRVTHHPASQHAYQQQQPSSMRDELEPPDFIYGCGGSDPYSYDSGDERAGLSASSSSSSSRTFGSKSSSAWSLPISSTTLAEQQARPRKSFSSFLSWRPTKSSVSSITHDHSRGGGGGGDQEEERRSRDSSSNSSSSSSSIGSPPPPIPLPPVGNKTNSSRVAKLNVGSSSGVRHAHPVDLDLRSGESTPLTPASASTASSYSEEGDPYFDVDEESEEAFGLDHRGRSWRPVLKDDTIPSKARSFFSAAVDVVAIVNDDAPDGAKHIRCTPFYVRFGRFAARGEPLKKVSIYVNGCPCNKGIEMCMDETGMCFFTEEEDEAKQQQHQQHQHHHKDELDDLDEVFEGVAHCDQEKLAQQGIELDTASAVSSNSADNDYDNDDDHGSNGGSLCTSRKSCKKLRPTQEQLASLPLKRGLNTLVFEVTTKRGRKKQVEARLFLWSNKSKIVVSDVDSTITKGDLAGILLPYISGNKIGYRRPGITKFYHELGQSGYNIVYLTSRWLSQASSLRRYLFKMQSSEGYTFPVGPVFTSPDRFRTAMNREAIIKNPEAFKIKMLQGLRSCFDFSDNEGDDEYNKFNYYSFFNEETCRSIRDAHRKKTSGYSNVSSSSDHHDHDHDHNKSEHATCNNKKPNPFYAGFGNKINDIYVYATVGVSDHLNFMINDACNRIVCPKENSTKNNSYPSFDALLDRKHKLFPPCKVDHQYGGDHHHRHSNIFRRFRSGGGGDGGNASTSTDLTKTTTRDSSKKKKEVANKKTTTGMMPSRRLSSSGSSGDGDDSDSIASQP